MENSITSHHIFPAQLYRAEINPEDIDGNDLDKTILQSIEDALTLGIRKIFIAFIAHDSEKASVAPTFPSANFAKTAPTVMPTFTSSVTPVAPPSAPKTSSWTIGKIWPLESVDGKKAIVAFRVEGIINYITPPFQNEKKDYYFCYH